MAERNNVNIGRESDNKKKRIDRRQHAKIYVKKKKKKQEKYTRYTAVHERRKKAQTAGKNIAKGR